MKGEDQDKLLDLTVRTLSDRVVQSFQVDGDFTTSDAEMLTRLVRDTWSFSAAKNYQETRDLTLALKDEKGNLREFSDFKDIAEGITEKYNQTWLRTEYDFAISASQSAARWNEFEREADVIPNLQYQTVGDDHVRASHQILDGIIRPINDTFWSTHYPPNGWGCRCEAIQSLGDFGKVTPDKDVPYVDIPQMFNTNLAQTGLIYPKNHPYYVDVPRAEMSKALAYLPPKNTFLDVNIDGHNIGIHPMHGAQELKGNLSVACDFMNLQGDKIKGLDLLPDIHIAQYDQKVKYYPKDFILRDKNKNADGIISFNDGSKWVVDFKNMQGNGNNLASHIHDAYLKADYAIVKINNLGKTLNQIKRTVKTKMNELKELKGVIVMKADGSIIYEKYR